MFKKNKEEYDYFSAFEEVSKLIIQAADFLSTNLKSYKLESLEKQLEEIHKMEHAGDERKHQMMEYLYQDFLPPIERDDIIELAHGMDNVLDNIEDVLIRMDMYQIETIQPDMLAFMELVKRASQKLSEIIKELSNFKKSKVLLPLTIEINSIEEEGDVIYHRAIKSLHIDDSNLQKNLGYSKIYDAFEKSCDSFESVANIVEAIILKNS